MHRDTSHDHSHDGHSHGHAHAHGAAHAHAHAHAHGHVHAHAPTGVSAPRPAIITDPPVWSLLRASLVTRLMIALGLSGLLWAAVLMTLAGGRG